MCMYINTLRKKSLHWRSKLLERRNRIKEKRYNPHNTTHRPQRKSGDAEESTYSSTTAFQKHWDGRHCPAMPVWEHLPRMWATASTRSGWLPPSFFTETFSARTKLDMTGWGWFRKMSSTSRHELICWGMVPPTTTSLFPIVFRRIPTSPMAPHWIARPGGEIRRTKTLGNYLRHMAATKGS